MSKERTIDEYRQVKAFGYVAPHSHDKRLETTKSISLTKEGLHDFAIGLLEDVIGIEGVTIDEDSLAHYINEHFD